MMKKIKNITHNLTSKDKRWLTIANVLLVLYIYGIGLYALCDGNIWTLRIGSWKAPLIFVLLLMFIFELGSTISFQLRIWLTSKNKIRAAAILGSVSWLIAGLQGILLVSSVLNGIDIWLSFLIKAPPISVATFSGILINNSFNKKKG